MALSKGQFNSGVKNLIPFPSGKSGYHFTKRQVICVICGTKHETTGPNTKFCSNDCKEKSRPDKQKTLFTCEFCERDFRRRAPDNAGRFCSRQCSGLWLIANGKKNYFYRAFLYLQHKCDICGIEDFSILLVHHKDKNKYNMELSNLQILCANCHYKIHFGNGSVRHKKIRPIIEYLTRMEKENVSA